MAVHGFAKIVEFSLLKLQERGKHKQQEHEVHRVGKEMDFHIPFHKTGSKFKFFIFKLDRMELCLL